MERKDYTLEVYKKDRRTKVGERMTGKYDYRGVDPKWMNEELKDLSRSLYPKSQYRLELHETYVTRTNHVSGNLFSERYDTPSYCSPSSEAYWAM